MKKKKKKSDNGPTLNAGFKSDAEASPLQSACEIYSGVAAHS